MWMYLTVFNFVIWWLLLDNMDQFGLSILDHLDDKLFYFVSWMNLDYDCWTNMVNLKYFIHLTIHKMWC